jgi:hypothetical protein
VVYTKNLPKGIIKEIELCYDNVPTKQTYLRIA